MEIYQLKYFLAAAELENFQKAAAKIHTTPPSITKAVAALENELGVGLFAREGRNVRLTKQGRTYYERVRKMLAELTHAHVDLVGEVPEHPITLIFAGREILLLEFALPSLGLTGEKPLPWNFQFIEANASEAQSMVDRGLADVAIVARKPGKDGLSKHLGSMVSKVFCHPTHPLAKQKKRSIPINELLKFPFVAPHSPIFGKVSDQQSPDGWRDDAYPRKVPIMTQNLGIMLDAVARYQYLAFFPEYFGERNNLHAINVSGCSYVCHWDVYLFWRHAALQPVLQRWFK